MILSTLLGINAIICSVIVKDNTINVDINNAFENGGKIKS